MHIFNSGPLGDPSDLNGSTAAIFPGTILNCISYNSLVRAKQQVFLP